MLIKELSIKTGISEKTIRFYEEVNVLPKAQRLPNGYRFYDEIDIERVKFIKGMRQLNFSLDDIKEIMDMKERWEPPCRIILDLIQEKSSEIESRIKELQIFKKELEDLHKEGLTFPVDVIDGKNCVCHLVTERAK